MKVLLVEDEEFIRDLFKRQLDLSGFTTDAFGTGQDGLNAISKNAYDLVLLDIMLPDINGLQILQNIRSNPTTKTIAVVLLTNLGQDAVIKQGFELGADGYLVKAAYTPDQIVQEVKIIMQKKQAQNQAHNPATPSLPGQNPMPAQAPVASPPIPGTFTPPALEPSAMPLSDSEVVSQPVSPDSATPTATPEPTNS
jgi:DNA-binding response OmpR family regulator